MKLLLSITALCLLSQMTSAQNVGINNTGAAPDASAMLDLVAADKGLLIPRVALTITTATGPVTAPTTSLLVYNTATVADVTPGYYFWDGAAWNRLLDAGTADGDWTVSGINQYSAVAGNVGIGTAAPAEKLDIIGDLRVSTGQINAAGDHLSLMQGVRGDDVAYEWTGWYSGGTRQGIILYDGAWGGANSLTNEFSITAENNNHLTLNTGAGEHVLLMPKTTGNVGVKTLSPTDELTVNGWIGRTAHNNGALVGSYNSVGANSAQTNPIYTIGSNYKPAAATLTNMYGIGYTHSNATFITPNFGGWGMYVAADGDARIYLNASANGSSYFNAGNVGIGTTAPTGKLQVNNVDGSLMRYGGTGNLSMFNPEAFVGEVRIGAAWNRPGVYSSQQLELFSDNIGVIFGDSNIERMRLTAGGSLGIGTAAPAQRLHVIGTGRFSSLAGVGNRMVIANANGDLLTQAIPGGAGIWTTIGADHHEINMLKDAEIRYSQFDLSGNDFGVGPGVFWGSDPFEDTGMFTDGDQLIFISPADNQLAQFWEEDLHVIAAQISGAGAYTQISDRNMKNNIELIPNGLDKILKLNGYTYEFKQSKEDIEKGTPVELGMGIIAQELKEVAPRLVIKTHQGHYVVNYDGIIPILIEAVKEQNQEIESLKTENLELQNKLSEMDALKRDIEAIKAKLK